MVWARLGWTRLLTVAAIVLFCAHMALLFHVNSLGSEIQNMELATRTVERDSTEVQTQIYTITRDMTFMQLASVNQLELREPRDIAILYMQLPDHALVLR